MPFFRFLPCFLTVAFAFFFFEKAASQTPDSTSSPQKRRGGSTVPAAVVDSLLPQKMVEKAAETADSTAFLTQKAEKDSTPEAVAIWKKPIAPVVRFFKKGYPNPRKALLFSALVPGGGQLYNQKYWKAPIAWAGIGSAYFLMIRMNGSYQKYQRNYLAFVDGDPLTLVEAVPINSKTNAPLFSELDKTSLKQGRDFFRTWRERSFLILGGAYVFAATEAFVNAHLATFDVSDDLSLRVRPAQISTARGPDAFGMSLAFSIRPKGITH